MVGLWLACVSQPAAVMLRAPDACPSREWSPSALPVDPCRAALLDDLRVVGDDSPYAYDTDEEQLWLSSLLAGSWAVVSAPIGRTADLEPLHGWVGEEIVASLQATTHDDANHALHAVLVSRIDKTLSLGKHGFDPDQAVLSWTRLEGSLDAGELTMHLRGLPPSPVSCTEDDDVAAICWEGLDNAGGWATSASYWIWQAVDGSAAGEFQAVAKSWQARIWLD